MQKRVEIFLPAITSSFDGFSALMNLVEKTDDLSYANVVIDLSNATRLDANMCAPLGAILYRISSRLNQVAFENIPHSVEHILRKNGFLSFYGQPKKVAEWDTTIQFNRFEQKDDRFFGAYIETHFKNKAIPQMSEALRKKFWESVFELFSNAVIHSETELGIFTCGQYFPQHDRVEFAIADLGVGIRSNLLAKKNVNLSSEAAINWAMEGQNTTKTGAIPGGLGLKLLREFIKYNRGRIQVVSQEGYWEQLADASIKMNALSYAFPGTVVNMEINTADTNPAILTSELQADEIF